MDISALSQLSVGVASVSVLGYVVKLFMKRLKERDDFLEKLIDNHFFHSQDRDEKIIRILEDILSKIK